MQQARNNTRETCGWGLVLRDGDTFFGVGLLSSAYLHQCFGLAVTGPSGVRLFWLKQSFGFCSVFYFSTITVAFKLVFRETVKHIFKFLYLIFTGYVAFKANHK